MSYHVVDHRLRSACLAGMFLACLGAPRGACAGIVTDVEVTNTTGLSADDLEVVFGEAGTTNRPVLTDASIVFNPDGAGSAGIIFSGDRVKITWDAPGLPDDKTVEFEITAPIGAPTLNIFVAQWTFENNQNNGTNNPIDVPADEITLTSTPEPSGLVLGCLAVVCGGLLHLKTRAHDDRE
jgi:hypothetical protein